MTSVSFEECFRDHLPRLVAIGEMMTGDRDVARELAQETFVRLHRNWTIVREYDNPGGWLQRVMGNLLIDHHRSRVSERRAIARFAEQVAVETDARGAVSDEWSELIAGLPLRQRLMLTLFYAEDLAVAEIAGVLDVSPNTVKSSLSKARDTLRARLEHPDV